MEWAIPFWIFITLFLVLPLVIVVWMTVERRRERLRQKWRGFELKLNTGQRPVPLEKERETDHG